MKHRFPCESLLSVCNTSLSYTAWHDEANAALPASMQLINSHETVLQWDPSTYEEVGSICIIAGARGAPPQLALEEPVIEDTRGIPTTHCPAHLGRGGSLCSRNTWETTHGKAKCKPAALAQLAWADLGWELGFFLVAWIIF